ncbi:MAG: hypothetical protein ABEJ67_01465 [Halanaeroarchaeum sp.]
MEGSRGQVVLVAALGIAVTLVALALVTNTVIYTQNLATRETADAVDSVAFQQATEEGVGGLVSLANRYNATSHSALLARLETDVKHYANATGIEAARNGRIASASVRSVTNGTRIFQNDTRNFTDVNGNESWTLATDVSNTRRFELNVSRNALNSSAPFRVRLSDGIGTDWTATFEPNGNDIAVTIDNGSAVTCTVTAAHTVVDLTEGTINGTDCDAPPFGSGVGSPYAISFENADHVAGRYVLFVDDATVDSGPYATDPTEDPNQRPAIYSATVHVRMVRTDLTYETNVTVAPEDSPEGEVYGVVP